MTRLARNRDTHLTPREIAVEALRQVDAGEAATIRGLATALEVVPSAIYHHYPSRGAILQAAVDIVWEESAAELVRIEPDPFGADPAHVLVVAGVAVRRTFERHYRMAPYAAATPAADGLMARTLALLAGLFERLGLTGDEAAAAFHTYASMALGSVIFTAMRRIADDDLTAEAVAAGESRERFRSNPGAEAASRASAATRDAIDDVVDISTVDRERDEQLFEEGLQRLIASFTPAPQRT